jgi:DNA-binding NtrC family response regulator
MNDLHCEFGTEPHQVLLVDDDPWMLKIMKAALWRSALVTTCTSGESALDLLEARRFDVVCSDWRMPDMDGIELLRRVAAARPGIGCLLVTGAARLPPDERRPYDVLHKPFDPERFAYLVMQLARAAQTKRSDRGDALQAAASGGEP